MKQRINYMQQSPELFKKFVEFNNALETRAIEQKTRDLVVIRASQMNGCAFCLDMHVKECEAMFKVMFVSSVVSGQVFANRPIRFSRYWRALRLQSGYLQLRDPAPLEQTGRYLNGARITAQTTPT